MLERARFWRKEATPQATLTQGPLPQPQQPSLEVRIFEEQHINTTLTIQTEPQKQVEPVPKAEIGPALEAEKPPFPRVLIVANRLSSEIDKTPEGYKLKASPGGLAKALHSVAKGNNGQKEKTGPEIRWLGWDGLSNGKDSETEGLEEAFQTLSADETIKLYPLSLTKEEHDAHYNHVSNEGFWMLFHDKLDLFKFNLADWKIYDNVNEKFAEKALSLAEDEDLVMIQDYHLMRVAYHMREMGAKQKLGFFLHIPFPTPDTLRHLPEKARSEMLEGLLAHDIVGFQTEKDRNNFIISVLTFVDDAAFNTEKDTVKIVANGRNITVGAFPISIDPQEVKNEVNVPEIHAKAEELRTKFEGKKIMTALSRLDPTKGILEAIDAAETAVNDHPELREQLAFNIVAQPSRLGVPAYKELYDDVQKRIEQANRLGQYIYFTPGMVFPYAMALLSITDINVVPSLADGMNLVAKEYAVVGPTDGIQILAQNAGAAQVLRDYALVIDPRDTRAFAKRIYEAVMMPDGERKKRMRGMEQIVFDNPVQKWADNYIAAARAA